MEISSKELKIGNYMMAGSLLTQVTTINRNNFIVTELETSDGEFNYNSDQCNINPVILTEEWLIKFGFEKREVYMLGVKYDGWLNFSFHLDINHIKNTYFYHWMGGNIEVKHVHQLQNLYFALTGEELTVK
ncbi:hypothetical protein [Chryseobacterium sp. SIMBA_028]|uniref:hypothetical protein n=1 Tax=Chryseobacterium sp. SIMBA_028 TaxID=3085771 RepID=UPI003979F941